MEEVKKNGIYILFAFDAGDAEGGIADIIGVYDSVSEAKHHFDGNRAIGEIVSIVDKNPEVISRAVSDTRGFPRQIRWEDVAG